MSEMFRDRFPIFKRFSNTGTVYFDNASTTLKPIDVIERVSSFYSEETSSVARGTHSLAEKNGLAFEDVRQRFAEFINASSDEIIFTKNCTGSINLVASGVCCSDKDEFIVSILEHHSNFLPWKKRGKVRCVGVDVQGRIDLNELADLISKDTKLIAVTMVSNVTGNVQPVKRIAELARSKGVLTLVDAAQAAGHMPIDVRDIGCDFMSFSAHKMFGPSGLGMLYAKKECMHMLKPNDFGGGMVNKVSQEDLSFKEAPYLFEAGTPNIEGVLGLGGALDFLSKNQGIFSRVQVLEKYLLERMKELLFINFPFPVSDDHVPIISFRPNSGINDGYVASILSDSHGICVRSGYHCAQPLFSLGGEAGVLRASLHVYNTEDEIDRFVSVLNDLKPMLE